jgi:pilus assembly protein Flp/PilA
VNPKSSGIFPMSQRPPRWLSPRPSRWPLDLRRFAADESGATAVEYGLLAALIALTIFAAISSVGQGIKNTLYGQIVTALQNMGK